MSEKKELISLESPNLRKSEIFEGPMGELVDYDVGKIPRFGRRMTPAEEKQIQRMERKAEEMGITVEELDKFNIFAPEVELRDFVQTIIEKKGNLNAAVRKCYPEFMTRGPAACHAKGMMMLRGEHAQMVLKEAMDVNSISVNNVLGEISNIAKSGKNEFAKLKALEMLGVFLKIFNANGEISTNSGTVNYNLNINEDAARRILDRRRRYDIGEEGNFEGVKRETGDRRNESSVIDGEEVID